MTPGYYSRSLDGHRAAYLEFVTTRFGGQRVTAWQVLARRGPVLFLMIEEHFGLYVLASLWRSLLGRRTVGLLFRPGPASAGTSWRLRLKRLQLRLMRRLPTVETLSIVPVPLQPRIGAIVDGWIHDFQLWDLEEGVRSHVACLRRDIAEPASETSLPSIVAEALKHANGRPLLVALGMQNRDKGVERLAASLREGGCTGWAVLVAGRFAPSADAARREIEACGGRVIDRFLDSEELLALYAVADAVWCLYDPAYDQASGILGRALQLGVPPVVRRHSISAALCVAEGISHLAVEGGADLAPALATLIASDTRQPRTAPGLAQASTARLRRALGLPMAATP